MRTVMIGHARRAACSRLTTRLGDVRALHLTVLIAVQAATDSGTKSKVESRRRPTVKERKEDKATAGATGRLTVETFNSSDWMVSHRCLGR
jgi:hypothetical protein